MTHAIAVDPDFGFAPRSINSMCTSKKEKGGKSLQSYKLHVSISSFM